MQLEKFNSIEMFGKSFLLFLVGLLLKISNSHTKINWLSKQPNSKVTFVLLKHFNKSERTFLTRGFFSVA